jgi:nucleotide-binding universal stress UspA family protein
VGRSALPTRVAIHDHGGMSHGRIVVGAQASAGSLAALAWALPECRRRNAELLLIHAVDGGDTGRTAETVEGREATGRAELDVHREAATRVAPDVRVSTELIDLAPGDALIAASERADLVVLGSRGRADLTTSALGSVAHRTAVHAHCPVVIVRAETAPSRQEHVRRIVVGVADAPAGRAALRFAAEQAAAVGGRLHLVLCPADTPDGRIAAEEQLAAVRADLGERYPELTLEGDVANAEPVTGLLDASREADLIVLGCHHSEDPWASRIGGVAAGVLGRAGCPVVLVGTATSDTRR